MEGAEGMEVMVHCLLQLGRKGFTRGRADRLIELVDGFWCAIQLLQEQLAERGDEIEIGSGLVATEPFVRVVTPIQELESDRWRDEPVLAHRLGEEVIPWNP
ncbi:MAG: hypothetical protein D6720_08540 [Gammaproteobacteria bacterium]|nr:MAG: hypothetical protein D6720_08540 [Gammaproteobacteria bacterium]